MSEKKLAEKKPLRSLVNQCDLHWWATPEGYEHVKRTIFDLGHRSLSSAEREMWLGEGWENRLKEQRTRHREMGIDDTHFIHPKLFKKNGAKK